VETAPSQNDEVFEITAFTNEYDVSEGSSVIVSVDDKFDKIERC
jgi:hypothetical protein